ncbi:MAG: ankyrin repeat domain-containing protein [Alphaproteobacteria bacterium]
MGMFGPERTFIKDAGRGDLPAVASFIAENIPDTFSIDVKGGSGVTALMAAAANGRLEIIAKLLEKKASLEVADDSGRTALYHAAQSGKTEAVKALLAAGANPHTHDNDFNTPLIRAAENGDLTTVKMMAAARVEIDATTKAYNNTALIRAAENKRVQVMEFLILQGARIDLKDGTGRSAADYAKAYNLPIEAMVEAAQKAATQPTTTLAKDGEEWVPMGDASVARVATHPALGRKITEIFNFESRERLIITENLKTGAETLGQPEKFESLSEAVISRAEAARSQFTRKTFKL